MPKLAEKYDYNVRYSSLRKYSQPHISQINQYRQKTKKIVKQKRNPIHFTISCLIMLFMACVVMPFSCKAIWKSLFIPQPYKNITTDLRALALPTTNYLSNAWFMGENSFRYEAPTKEAQMKSLQENVNMPALKSELLALMEQYPQIKPAIYAWSYETGNYVDINATKLYSTASIIKIPVLIDLFKSIEAGQLRLDEKMPLTEYYRTEGSGDLQFKAENSVWNIDELARVMITNSDNSATNMLVAKLGSMTDINKSIRGWGLKNTEIQAWLPDLDGHNHTTAKEMATMLYNIENNDDFLTEASRSKMLDYMGHVHNNRLIQAGLGEGSVFYHKTGDIGSMLGDAGIVIAPNGNKYVIVILAQRPHNDYAGKEFIVNASKIIYNYMVK